MITPLDIENKKFKKKPFGYDEKQVEDFLDLVVRDYEKLYKENLDLKDKISLLSENMQQYKTLEETLQNTLIIAQNTGEEIKKSAYSKADSIIKEAEIKASQIIENCNQEILRLQYKKEELQRNFTLFRTKLEALIYSQLDLMKEVEK